MSDQDQPVTTAEFSTSSTSSMSSMSSMSSVGQGASDYGASDIIVLEGLEAVRKRPGMYIGSLGERGLHQLVLALFQRSVVPTR